MNILQQHKPAKILFALFIPAMLILGLTGTNQTTFLWLNQVSVYTGAEVWVHLTHIGDAAIIFAFSFLLLFYRPILVGDILIGAVVTSIFIQSIKYGLNLDRPPAVFERDEFLLLDRFIEPFSFPSGHTASAFLIAAIVLYRYRLSVYAQISILFVALLIGFSRIAVGVHWPLDVMAGAMFGWLSGWITVQLNQKWQLGSTGRQRWWMARFYLIPAYVLAAKPKDFDNIPEFYCFATLLLLFSLTFYFLKEFNHLADS